MCYTLQESNRIALLSVHPVLLTGLSFEAMLARTAATAVGYTMRVLRFELVVFEFYPASETVSLYHVSHLLKDMGVFTYNLCRVFLRLCVQVLRWDEY